MTILEVQYLVTSHPIIFLKKSQSIILHFLENYLQYIVMDMDQKEFEEFVSRGERQAYRHGMIASVCVFVGGFAVLHSASKLSLKHKTAASLCINC
jgi:hypothetical protein